jgi:uncharacterized protein (DUF433 family)
MTTTPCSPTGHCKCFGENYCLLFRVNIQNLTRVLILQVWLFVTYTALAIDVEVEAIPDHVNGCAIGKQFSGDDDGDNRGHGHKKELSKDQKSILMKILDFLEMNLYPSATGDFTFNGQRIPIDFIQTAVSLDSKTSYTMTVEDLWEKIQLYEDYAKKVESEPPNREISKYEQVIMLYAITYMRNNGTYRGNITMDGARVPLRTIMSKLKDNSTDIYSVTTVEMLHAIRWYTHIGKYRTPTLTYGMNVLPLYEEDDKAKIVLEFLKTQRAKPTGSFMFGLIRVPIRFILWRLLEDEINVKYINYGEMWVILHAYIPRFREFNRLPVKEKTDLQNILKYLKFLGDGAIGELTFKSYRLSIDFIMTVVLIQGADIYSLTMADLWELIKMYEFYVKKLGGEPQSQNISKYEQVTLLYAITYLRYDDGITGQIVIDGVKIPVSYILTQLKISGKDISTVNIEQIHTIISAYISTYTPPTPVSLGKRPTEEQTFELKAITDLLKMQRSAAMGSFLFSGYRISVQFILSSLAQRRQWIDNLRPKELWNIMLLHESKQTQPLQ